LKLTNGNVAIRNKSFASVPVFDTEEMILSIIHDPTIMYNENFAMGLDIFMGDTDPTVLITDVMERFIQGYIAACKGQFHDV
jgi:hypothetical protein